MTTVKTPKGNFMLTATKLIKNPYVGNGAPTISLLIICNGFRKVPNPNAHP